MPIFKAISPKRRVKPRSPVLTILPVIGLFFLLGLILWYSYPRSSDDNSAPQAVPIIRADATPYKVLPSEPGGMEIPYRDSTVFETLRTARLEEGAPPKIESLLADTEEEPVDRSALFAGLKTDVDADVDAEDTAVITEDDAAEASEVAAIVPQEEIVKETVKEAVTEEVQVIAATAKPVINEDADANGAAKTEPAAGDATVKVAGSSVYNTDPEGGFYVQLGSFRSASDAEKGWAGAQKTFPSLLSALDLHVQQADLGERGTFFRMQAGPLGKTAANEICTQIKKEKAGGCLVVSR